MLVVLWRPLPKFPSSFAMRHQHLLEGSLSFLFGKTNPIVNMNEDHNQQLFIHFPSYSPNTTPMANYERKPKKKTHIHPGLVSLFGKTKTPIINMNIMTIYFFGTY